MVRGVLLNSSLPDIGVTVSAASGRKLALPVEPNALIYSHFKNVFGIPAPDGSPGVSINKLNILNSLIEQMKQMNRTPLFADMDLPEESLNALIDNYASQIRSEIENLASLNYTAPLPETGLVFDFSA